MSSPTDIIFYEEPGISWVNYYGGFQGAASISIEAISATNDSIYFSSRFGPERVLGNDGIIGNYIKKLDNNGNELWCSSYIYNFRNPADNKVYC